MREIKFRGKRSWNDEWVYGNLVIDKYGRNHIVPFAYFDEDGHHLSYDDDTDKPVFIKQDSIGQFTGLHDKNGKEIYEGDVLKDKYENRGTAHWYGSGFEFINTSGMMEDGNDYEIIGNIHEQQS